METRRDERGFASMDADKQREIARKGGRTAHERGTAHQFTPEEAREAGRKGGATISRDKAHMSRIGRKGGEASQGPRKNTPSNGAQHSNGNAERENAREIPPQPASIGDNAHERADAPYNSEYNNENDRGSDLPSRQNQQQNVPSDAGNEQ